MANTVRRVAVVSDIHFDAHHRAGWAAFVEWHRREVPDEVVFLGDFVDFGMLSRYVQSVGAPVKAIPQIQLFVREANRIARRGSVVTVQEGNHDERWGRALGLNPVAFEGALGLTLHDQCLRHGLDEAIQWRREGKRHTAHRVGPFYLRHGHNQAGRFGGAIHIAANRLRKSNGRSEVVGHHHRAQLHASTCDGETVVGIANPCLTEDHDYAVSPDWQRGFTLIETFGPRERFATAFPIIMADEGSFAYGGHHYDGPALVRAAARKLTRDRARAR